MEPHQVVQYSFHSYISPFNFPPFITRHDMEKQLGKLDPRNESSIQHMDPEIVNLATSKHAINAHVLVDERQWSFGNFD